MRAGVLAAAVGPAHIVPGWFTLDRDLTVADDGSVILAPATAQALARVIEQFSASLHAHHASLAPAG
ncbi:MULTISPECIES: hypothetical protein [Streptomyces]|uniref:hypothetical protein n=1 Tax=Streptomyces TaxID=1883 RepID=UPI00369C44CE